MELYQQHSYILGSMLQEKTIAMFVKLPIKSILYLVLYFNYCSAVKKDISSKHADYFDILKINFLLIPLAVMLIKHFRNNLWTADQVASGELPV